MIFNIPVPAFSTVEVSIPLVVLLYVAYAIIMVPVFMYALRDDDGKNELKDWGFSILLASVWPFFVIFAIVAMQDTWEELLKKRRHG